MESTRSAPEVPMLLSQDIYEVHDPSPPTYSEAARDQVPSYVTAIAALPPEPHVDGLRLGSPITLLLHMLASGVFGILGFLGTYLVHSSHASKQGSRLGLGLTFIRYSIESRPVSTDARTGRLNDPERLIYEQADEYNEVSLVGIPHEKDTFESPLSRNLADYSHVSLGMRLWDIFLLVLGIAIVIKSVVDYIRMFRKINSLESNPEISAPQAEP